MFHRVSYTTGGDRRISTINGMGDLILAESILAKI